MFFVIFTEKINHDKLCKNLDKIIEDFEEFFLLFLAEKIWIRIRISLKSGIRIRIKTFWIRHSDSLKIFYYVTKKQKVSLGSGLSLKNWKIILRE